METFKFENGGDNPGELIVSRDRFYGEEYVTLELDPAANAVYLTAGQARAVAHELMTEAAALDMPPP